MWWFASTGEHVGQSGHGIGGRAARVRTDQAPEAAVHAYDGPPSYLEEFYPGTVGDLGVDSSSQ